MTRTKYSTAGENDFCRFYENDIPMGIEYSTIFISQKIHSETRDGVIEKWLLVSIKLPSVHENFY